MSTFTRQQYLNKECTHREYWAQFVTAGMKSMVARNFDLGRLQRSQDKYFNDVTRVSDWDIMRGNTFHMLDLKKWREIHYPEYTDPRSIGWSSSDNTCLLKEAARQLVDEAAAVSA